jgi:hypothetical protein
MENVERQKIAYTFALAALSGNCYVIIGRKGLIHGQWKTQLSASLLSRNCYIIIA